MTPAEVLELARKHGATTPIDDETTNYGEEHSFDTDDLSALVAEVEARTLERAAVECENVVGSPCCADTEECAAAIRSLKPGQGADSQGGRG